MWFILSSLIGPSLYIKRGCASVRPPPISNVSYLLNFAQFCASVTILPQKVLYSLNFAHYFMLSQWYFCFCKKKLKHNCAPEKLVLLYFWIFQVTVAEVQRRLSPPECLNASLLGGVLRRWDILIFILILILILILVLIFTLILILILILTLTLILILIIILILVLLHLDNNPDFFSQEQTVVTKTNICSTILCMFALLSRFCLTHTISVGPNEYREIRFISTSQT